MKKILIFLLIVALFTGCTPQNPKTNATPKVYYTNTSSNELVAVEVSVDIKDVSDAANELFRNLYLPPQKKLSSALPSDVKLIDLSISGHECRLTLSDNFLTRSVFSKNMMYGAITKTLCTLPEINKVKISCGDVAFTFTADDFLTELPKAYYETRTLTLYYPKNDFFSVKKEYATITMTPDIDLAQTAVSFLMTPPSDELLSPFPEGCEVYDIYMEGNICVIDVSQEFVSHNSHDRVQETSILFSIVNTLTELPEIDKVRFLVDGKTNYGYSYHSISGPFAHSPLLSEIIE